MVGGTWNLVINIWKIFTKFTRTSLNHPRYLVPDFVGEMLAVVGRSKP